MGTTSLDPAAVLAAAHRLDAAATALLDAADSRLASRRFDAAAAGPAHTAAGAALRLQTERLATDLVRWAYAAGELAAVLRAGADGHAAAEADATAALR